MSRTSPLKKEAIMSRKTKRNQESIQTKQSVNRVDLARRKRKIWLEIISLIAVLAITAGIMARWNAVPASLIAPEPVPSPTPVLAKEYIYAGSRLLAVEDANANAPTPTAFRVGSS